MIVILAILAATHASPLGSPSNPLLSRDQLQAPSCSDPDGCRSLWDIIRSCLFTILLCTWASMHPNIPSPDERWPKIASRGFGLMLATLIMPEAIIGWALRQRLAAAELAKKHEAKQWTITHGFFAVMGGFMEYDGNRPIRVLLPAQLQPYSLTGNGDFPRISKAEIEDKSKGNAISKMFVVLQTGWFAIQCIARVHKGLPITELELVTLAFATLNFGIYLLWWHKPLNVHRGVRVYKQRKTEQPIDDGDVEAAVGCWEALQDACFELPTAIADGPLRHIFPQFPWILRVIVWLCHQPQHILGILPPDVHQIYETLMVRRVTTFYPGKWGTHLTMPVLVMTTIASAFGGIHCIGWSFTFPSSTERTLWRVTSASIVVVPLVLLLFSPGPILNPRKYLTLLIFLTICIILLISFYVLCRLVLLVLPFLCLRSLPPAAYHVVQWTSLIPHV